MFVCTRVNPKCQESENEGGMKGGSVTVIALTMSLPIVGVPKDTRLVSWLSLSVSDFRILIIGTDSMVFHFNIVDRAIVCERCIPGCKPLAL